jgi:hypothetical protein
MMTTSHHITRTMHGDFTFRQRDGDGVGGDLRGALIYPRRTRLLIFVPPVLTATNAFSERRMTKTVHKILYFNGQRNYDFMRVVA